MLNWLFAHVPYKDIGWKDHGETFFRFALLKTRWCNLYLHYAVAPDSRCHDHPWHFWALVLAGGYWENGVFRKPGSLLYRHAKTRHLVVTDGPSWSLVLTSRKIREWGLTSCE